MTEPRWAVMALEPAARSTVWITVFVEDSKEAAEKSAKKLMGPREIVPYNEMRWAVAEAMHQQRISDKANLG